MGRNQGVYRRSQSQLPRPKHAGNVFGGPRHKPPPPFLKGPGHKEPENGPLLSASQHLGGAGVVKPTPARERTKLVELESLASTTQPGVAVRPEPVVPSETPTTPVQPGAGTGALVQFAAGCALAAWCYGRVLARDLEWWRGTLAILLLPVLVWAAARLAAARWPWTDDSARSAGNEPSDALTPTTGPAVRKPMWVGLAALTVLALTVSLG